MAKIIARNARILFGGHDISGQSNNATLDITAEAPEVTCFTDSYKVRLQDGLKDSTLSVDGFVNTSASSTDDLYSSFVASPAHWSFFPKGYGASQIAYMAAGIVDSYSAKYATPNAATITTKISGCGKCWRGLSIGSTAAAAGSGLSACSINFGATDTQAQFALMHVLTNGGGVAACLMHSTDDSTFTAAYDFGAAVTESGSAYAGSVASLNQYRKYRYAYTTGAGEIVMSVSGSSV